MAGGFTRYGRDALMSGTALPQTLYCKAHTGSPGVSALDNAATETQRAAMTLTDGEAEDRVSDADVTWTSVGAADTITWLSLWDASTAGNPWIVADLDPTAEFVFGNNTTIPAGSILLALPKFGD